MSEWGPTQWVRRLRAAFTRPEPRPHFVTRLEEIGSDPENGPRHDFRARLREELLTAATTGPETDLRLPRELPRRTRRPSLLLRLRPGAVIAALAALIFYTGTETYASLPGDRLYPIKRAAEATLLSLTTDDAARAERELDAAHSRATEAAALLGYPDERRARLIGPTLDEMDSSTRSALSALGHVKRKGDDPQPPAIKRFTDAQRDVVEPMIPQLGGDDRMKASAYLDMIDGLTPPGAPSPSPSP